MKKTFLATRNTVLSSARVSWGVFALAFALLVLLFRLFAPDVFWYAVMPLFRTSDAIAQRSRIALNALGDTSTLALRNEALVAENAALTNDNRALVERNAALLALAGSSASSRSNAQGVVAGVVARPPESPYDTLVLAAGADEGVMLGQEAFAVPAGRQGPGGVPLGVVSSVTAHFSRVTLFSTPGVTTAGWVGQAHTALSIVGGGGGTMNASVSHSSGVAVGDTVFAPGPGMLPVGTVVRVDSNPSSPSVTLRIKPLLNPSSISWVLLRDTGASLLAP